MISWKQSIIKIKTQQIPESMKVFFMLLCNHTLLEQLQCMLALIMQVPGNVLEEKSCSLLRNIPSISVSMLLVENAAQNVGK